MRHLTETMNTEIPGLEIIGLSYPPPQKKTFVTFNPGLHAHVEFYAHVSTNGQFKIAN